MWKILNWFNFFFFLTIRLVSVFTENWTVSKPPFGHTDSSVDQKSSSRLRGLCKQQLMDFMGLETVEMVPSSKLHSHLWLPTFKANEESLWQNETGQKLDILHGALDICSSLPRDRTHSRTDQPLWSGRGRRAAEQKPNDYWPMNVKHNTWYTFLIMSLIYQRQERKKTWEEHFINRNNLFLKT